MPGSALAMGDREVGLITPNWKELTVKGVAATDSSQFLSSQRNKEQASGDRDVNYITRAIQGGFLEEVTWVFVLI